MKAAGSGSNHVFRPDLKHCAVRSGDSFRHGYCVERLRGSGKDHGRNHDNLGNETVP